ncbi:MAG: serine hydrolase, partial [Proteobacteria bacterium]
MPLGHAHADDTVFENAFDQMLGTDARTPRSYNNPFDLQIASLAEASRGRIGVAAIDLANGRTIEVLGNQRFPMASTSKIAIAATFLEGVDKGRWTLDQQFPLMVPQASKRLSTKTAPVKPGRLMSAREMIERMITRSDNQATDGLLAVVGGPQSVNSWVRRAGISSDGFSLDRDIATLVRDETEFDPATYIDKRDSATPLAMAQMLSGLHQGKWLSAQSRQVLIGAMERCITGKNRIPGKMPSNVLVAHKTGSLYNTS